MDYFDYYSGKKRSNLIFILKITQPFFKKA
jgi:hypothetical protein